MRGDSAWKSRDCPQRPSQRRWGKGRGLAGHEESPPGLLRDRKTHGFHGKHPAAIAPLRFVRTLSRSLSGIHPLVIAWAVGAAIPAAAEPPPPHEPEHVLFDGRSFAGWEGDTVGVWRIEDGGIVAGDLSRRQEKNDFLCTTARYGDFDLALEIQLEGSDGFVNSGIQFRSERVPGSHEVTGYQADFGKGYDGALYDESRRNRMLARPSPDVFARATRPGEWNAYRIRAEGPRIRLWLNGVLTVDYTEAEPGIPQTGVIALQIHGNAVSQVRFRSITLDDLASTAR